MTSALLITPLHGIKLIVGCNQANEFCIGRKQEVASYACKMLFTHELVTIDFNLLLNKITCLQTAKRRNDIPIPLKLDPQKLPTIWYLYICNFYFSCYIYTTFVTTKQTT